MANINLATERHEDRMLGTGTSALLFVFLVISLVYLGLYFYSKKLEDDKQLIINDYKSKLGAFVMSDAKNVLDFQNRLTIADKLMVQERNVNRDMESIEKAMITEVYLGSYEYDESAKTITLECYANDYKKIAQQIYSFKSLGYFSSVVAGESKFDSKHKKIGFPVILTIK